MAGRRGEEIAGNERITSEIGERHGFGCGFEIGEFGGGKIGVECLCAGGSLRSEEKRCADTTTL